MVCGVFMEETWHTVVWVTLSESTTISPCVLAVCPSAPTTPAHLPMLHLQQVCAPFLGCQGIFDGAKKIKIKGIWGKKHYLELTFYCKNISSGNVKNMFDVETRTFPSYIKLENII